jgi:hypothetical protein
VTRRPPIRGTRRPPARGIRPQSRPGVPDQKVANRVAVTSAPVLARLVGLPKYLPALGVLVVLFAGLIAGGVIGLLLLLALAGALGWFLAAFWPMTPTSGRVLRLSVVVALVVIGIVNVGH